MIKGTQCVKVAALRKEWRKDGNLRTWMEEPGNLYVGRRGRIFIDKGIFHYQGSKWANPFKVEEKNGGCTLQEAVRKFEEYVRSDSKLWSELDELEGKVLGCFCDQRGPCHAQVLGRLLAEKKEFH